MANFNTHMTKAQILTALQNGTSAMQQSDLDYLHGVLESEISVKADESELISISEMTNETLQAHRDVIADLINAGAKNLLDLSRLTTQTINGITWTVDAIAGTVTANGTATANSFFYIWAANSNIPVDYASVLSGCPNGGGEQMYETQAAIGSTVYHDYGDGKTARIPSGTIRYVTCCVRNGQTVSDLVFRPMFCRKSYYDITNDFMPYVPTNAELYAMIMAL